MWKTLLSAVLSLFFAVWVTVIGWHLSKAWKAGFGDDNDFTPPPGAVTA